MERTAEPPRPWALTLGANVERGGVRVRVWAPEARRVAVVVRTEDGAERRTSLSPVGDGYHEGMVAGARAGMRYKFALDDTLYPDPASRSQPDGVHGWSEVVDPSVFSWSDDEWAGVSADDLIVYELHVGTFTPGGTFDSAIARLDFLKELGVTAVEVMPIASFAGDRNWGYDGVDLYAPAAVYGGPDAFKRFVDAAHARGLGVILDVVYNHFGPDGNYLPEITGGRLFNEQRKTPWGGAVNFDGPEGGPVRDFIIQNALYWAHELHVDGLRLDAAHAIVDESSVHLLREIADRLHGLERPRVLVAEDERNERRLVLPPEEGGMGLDAVWADDFHHQVRRLVAGDTEGYFAAYGGTVDELAETLRKGWYYEGQFSPHANAPRGTPADGIPLRAFVHCIQNHDQVGNRPMGDRLNHVVSPGAYRAVSTLLLLAPSTPMLWMGQEWAASSPFRYFTHHGAELGALVTQGRREEFEHFSGFSDPALRERIPDPQAESTFLSSKLRWDEIEDDAHRGVLELYRELLAMRRSEPALLMRDRESFAVGTVGEHAVVLHRGVGLDDEMLIVVNVREGIAVSLEDAEEAVGTSRAWELALSTEEPRFGGGGQAIGRTNAGSIIQIDVPGALVFRAEPG